MENFVVSARKYRPALFNTVVGQSSITTTLKNAIRSNHLAQAFLFCGPRGVGKTTCARILAKTINCTNLTSETEACNQCESCTSFNQGQAIDIYELDAASNNSVDDIRNLVDTVRIPPQLMESNSNAKKVYVIDEVHMLSAAAFNAFLKTLEEPPRYAIFILATTERHKILPTILSRCQIFNFNRIQVDDIAGHLAYIANNENVIADPDALHIIAQKADGALRDACSIFDQVVSFAGTNLTYKAVIENLNVLDYEYYFKMTDHLLADQIPNAMLVYNDILSNGFDGHTFVAGLAEHFRNLLVSKDPQTLQLLEAGQNIRERYKEQAMHCPPIFLLRGLSLITKCDVGYKSARNPRLLAEFMLMQLCALNGQSSGEKKNDELISTSFNQAPLTQIPTAQPTVSQHASAEKNDEVSTPTPTTSIDTNQVVAEKPAAVVSKEETQNTSSAPSWKKSGVGKINQFTNPTAAKTDDVATSNGQPDLSKPREPFTQQALEQAWKVYAEKVKPTNLNVSSAMSMNQPRKVSDTELVFHVLNAAALDSLTSRKTDIMTHLREHLRNYYFDLRFELNKEEGPKRIYTDQDRYDRLVELNPNLAKFKQQFDLDIY